VADVSREGWKPVSDAELADSLRASGDVLAFPEPSTNGARVVEDGRLAALSNRALRRAYAETSSAVTLLDEVPADLARAIPVQQQEADRRGFDLEIGRHDSRKATDPKRALLHRDEDRQPIEVLYRSARQRQLVRG
jgi:hypothetical protein